MIKLVIGNNVKKDTKFVDENHTLRQELETAQIDYTRGSVNLDGVTLGPGDLDKTFAQHGIKDKCYLLQVVKADNAA